LYIYAGRDLSFSPARLQKPRAFRRHEIFLRFCWYFPDALLPVRACAAVGQEKIFVSRFSRGLPALEWHNSLCGPAHENGFPVRCAEQETVSCFLKLENCLNSDSIIYNIGKL
jgi:hypothetical protein